jgi:ribonuclease HI
LVPKRRKKKIAHRHHLSPGALPAKLADKFTGEVLIFSDASKKTGAGIAAVLFLDNNSAPMTFMASRPMMGSNQLEFEAALFALSKAAREFPDRHLTLFSDNQDAVARLNNAKKLGIESDPELAMKFSELAIHSGLNHVEIHWIKSHTFCRGNILADQYAREAATGGSQQHHTKRETSALT